MKRWLHQWSNFLHKWLGLLVGLQVVAWLLGGALFALMPFEAWVKSGDFVRKPPVVKADAAHFSMARLAEREAPLKAIELTGQGTRLHYRLTRMDGSRALADVHTGMLLPRPDEARIRELAQDMMRDSSAPANIRLLKERESRGLGLVDEAGKYPVWQASFADRFNTRLYFAPETGEFMRARNDTWVLYDFFWRLHIMDYGDGADFNNLWMRILAPLALLLVASGVLLLVFTRYRLPPRKTSTAG
jgi:uncharacterized iron-regulated membrane protein